MTRSTEPSFCAEAWTATESLRASIDALPFVTELGAGTLDRDRFVYYLAQDTLYLSGYARALAAAAVRSESTRELAFYVRSAHETAVVEQELHRAHVDASADTKPSPTCTGYVSYLLGLAQTASQAELVAGVLPCFWVYADVGETLARRAGDLSVHPYGDWIATYADEAFLSSVRTAKEITDEVAARSDGATRQRMHDSFAAAVRWEWMFWDAAWRMETWPI